MACKNNTFLEQHFCLGYKQIDFIESRIFFFEPKSEINSSFFN